MDEKTQRNLQALNLYISTKPYLDRIEINSTIGNMILNIDGYMNESHKEVISDVIRRSRNYTLFFRDSSLVRSFVVKNGTYLEHPIEATNIGSLVPIDFRLYYETTDE